MVEASPERSGAEPPAAGEVDVATRLRLAIGRIGRRLRIEGGGGPTPSQTSALYTLSKEGPLRIGDLASREGVTAPTTTRVVAALEQSGLVRRTADPDDGRSWVIELTTVGQDLIDTLTRDHTAYLAAHVAGLAAEEREALVAALPVLEHLAADVH
jgi:DNA-binding MarR family transcriptional regulator